MKKAHDLGLNTFVSLEPVYYAEDALELIERTYPFVDQFKVGKLNYRPEAEKVNWKRFEIDVVAKLKSLNKDYYIKKDLARY